MKRKTLNHRPLPAMSSPVSPRRRDIGEVASLRAEGVERQPQIRSKRTH